MFFYVKTCLARLFSEKRSQKALRPFGKKSKELKNVIKKRYARIGIYVRIIRTRRDLE